MSLTPSAVPAIGNGRAALAPGDVRRPPIGRAIRRGIAAAALFTAFTLATKEVRPVYLHVPWAEDPYDTFVSFAMFFVPLAIGVAGVRLVLCRRSRPLPKGRLVGVVRAVWLALAVSMVTLAADWAGVLAGPLGGWGAARGWSVVGLASTTVIVTVAAAGMSRVRVPASGDAMPDGLADGLEVARIAAGHLGPFGRPVTAMVAFAETRIAPFVRRRPVRSAAMVSLAFAAGLALTSAREEGVAPVLTLIVAVATCGMFAFAVAGGAFLGFVAPAASTSSHRRLVVAAVAGSAAVPLSLAFRDAIWSLTGAGGGRGLPEIAVLVTASGVLAFATTLALLAAVARRT